MFIATLNLGGYVFRMETTSKDDAHTRMLIAYKGMKKEIAKAGGKKLPPYDPSTMLITEIPDSM